MRRIRTVTTSGIFEDEDLERQLANLERESVRKGNSGRTKLRRVKKENLVNMSSSSSQRAASEKYEQPSVMGGCNNYSSKTTRKEDEEMDLGTKEVESKGDFEGTFTRDPDSKFRTKRE